MLQVQVRCGTSIVKYKRRHRRQSLGATHPTVAQVSTLTVPHFALPGLSPLPYQYFPILLRDNRFAMRIIGISSLHLWRGSWPLFKCPLCPHHFLVTLNLASMLTDLTRSRPYLCFSTSFPGHDMLQYIRQLQPY